MAIQVAQTLALGVVADFASGRFAAIEARFSAQMRAAMPENGLASIWGDFVRAFGAFRRAGAPEAQPRDGVVLVVVPLAFARGALDLKLVFQGEALVGLFYAPHKDPETSWRAPVYAAGMATREIEVKVGPAERPLPGTLTLPAGVGKAPVVLLIPGSGPQDRDQSFGPNRPFRDIAAGLAARGVATLRFDKRTFVYPQEMAALANPTVRDEILDDAAAAVAWLAAHPELDARRIVVAGHSLGATLAPRIASQNAAVAAIAMLAPATGPLASGMVAQIRFLASLRSDPDPAQRVDAARPGDEGPPFMGVPLSYWADLNAHESAAEAAQLSIPLLVLRGGRDYQTTQADFDRLAHALAQKPRATLLSFPALNHLFMAGAGLPGPEDYFVAGHVALEAIDALAGFIAAL
jgi:dienelactone hydrolase